MVAEARILAALERGPTYEGLLLVIADCSRSHFYRVLDRLAAKGRVRRDPHDPHIWQLA